MYFKVGTIAIGISVSLLNVRASEMHLAAKGCYDILDGKAEIEDGASYYQAINRMILAPLRADSKHVNLANFLEHGLIVDGSMIVNTTLCNSLEYALSN